MLPEIKGHCCGIPIIVAKRKIIYQNYLKGIKKELIFQINEGFKNLNIGMLNRPN